MANQRFRPISGSTSYNILENTYLCRGLYLPLPLLVPLWSEQLASLTQEVISRHQRKDLFFLPPNASLQHSVDKKINVIYSSAHSVWVRVLILQQSISMLDVPLAVTSSLRETTSTRPTSQRESGNPKSEEVMMLCNLMQILHVRLESTLEQHVEIPALAALYSLNT